MPSIARGLAAAMGAPLAVRGRALDALLTPPGSATPAPNRTTAAVARRATAAAFAALRTLQRLPGWRNTCLYRAAAECLVLRGLGMPATLRLGVARVGGAVAAHAWVDCPGYRCRATDGGEPDAYTVLGRTAGTPA